VIAKALLALSQRSAALRPRCIPQALVEVTTRGNGSVVALVSITALDRAARAELTKWDWETLRFRRVWGVEALKCEGCGGETHPAPPYPRLQLP
jgi:hypothetical protein